MLAFGAYSVGLLNIGTTGELKTPEVSVSGGEVPNVEVETGRVNVGTREMTVDVPTVEVERADDDASTNE